METGLEVYLNHPAMYAGDLGGVSIWMHDCLRE